MLGSRIRSPFRVSIKKKPPPTLNGRGGNHHLVVVMTAVAFVFVLWNLGDCGLGCEEQGRDRGCVLDATSNDLRRIDDASFHQVFKLKRGGVEAFGAVHTLGQWRRTVAESCSLTSEPPLPF